MNPGIGEEATRGMFAALKDQPLSLALVIMNVCLLGFLYYQGTTAAEERKHSTELLYKNRTEVADLLARCDFHPKQP